VTTSRKHYARRKNINKQNINTADSSRWDENVNNNSQIMEKNKKIISIILPWQISDMNMWMNNIISTKYLTEIPSHVLDNMPVPFKFISSLWMGSIYPFYIFI
jgi:hypothetical protein